MKLYDLLDALDTNLPVWINYNGDADRFDNKFDVYKVYGNSAVWYITQDAEGIITIELW